MVTKLFGSFVFTILFVLRIPTYDVVIVFFKGILPFALVMNMSTTDWFQSLLRKIRSFLLSFDAARSLLNMCVREP